MLANKSQLNVAVRAGLAGAVTATLLNEVGKRFLPEAPRMDIAGERAIAGGMEAAGMQPPTGQRLFRLSLLGDVISNSAYYALVGVGGSSGAWKRGAAIGATAGLGAAFLPQRLGLGREPSARTSATRGLSFLWYTFAGLAAAFVASRSRKS